MRKVLIANRGEIAVRVARACRDAGLTSVAVYAEPDIDAVHVAVADESYALGGTAPGESYLDIGKMLDVARRSGADAVHPGYGFLSENASFAQAVIDAGLTWIGPPPSAIEALGDKVKARAIAQQVGAPLAPGTPDPVGGVDEVIAFADQFGMPIAIKAAYGGGGRGLKVVRDKDEIPELYDSAVREAVAAFGRGECFVERYLDRPRHVETQILADSHGTVMVVGTRDCSLQRRHQKVVEEAPAPGLSEAQVQQLYDASKAIASTAGYVGAGTCEFLVAQDGTVSFLEVNTRLQVEHPVTEETSGVDLVLGQFAIADGQAVSTADPTPRGHAFEWRINAEDPGSNFLPAPGRITAWSLPTGPGVRVDAGYRDGDVVPGQFDSLLAKLVVTGDSRDQALARSRRALAEFTVGGMPTIIPFHRAVASDPAFASIPFEVHTRWIETEWQGGIPPWGGDRGESEASAGRERITVEVSGRRFEVTLPDGIAATAGSGKRGAGSRKPSRRAGSHKAAAIATDALTAPMQGTIVKVAVADGDSVSTGDLVVVLEAMKMEQPITATAAGTVRELTAEVGGTVQQGATICRIVPAGDTPEA